MGEGSCKCHDEDLLTSDRSSLSWRIEGIKRWNLHSGNDSCLMGTHSQLHPLSAPLHTLLLVCPPVVRQVAVQSDHVDQYVLLSANLTVIFSQINEVIAVMIF